MDPERWQHIKAIFEEAVVLAADERAAFLGQACREDEALRARVEALLEADASMDPLLDENPAMLAEDLFDTDRVPLPDHIGPYRVLRLLGRGGMGKVYLAQHTDGVFKQPVALKIIRGGIGTDDLMRRFRLEWQVLASLNHPNIARLYDSVMTGDGHPFFVMEFIDGDPITAFCDKNKYTLRARLDLFTKICGATQHAHENQIIHRDIKPANVLITREGIPKLLDFGIAKVLDPDFTGATVGMTRTGVRVLTPVYASPGQIRGEPVTPISDVYSLGVLLYELLVGRPPHLPSDAPSRKIEYLVCEEDVVRPSLAIEHFDATDGEEGRQEVFSANRISAARGATSHQLARQLRGDLDTIVLKALQKDPARRYASAAALGNDIQRYLEGHPILARPDTFWYRTRKFVYRHRVGMSIMLALLGFLAATASLTWQNLRPVPPVTVIQDKDEVPKRLVALPFRHQGPEEIDYLANGMTEAITAYLSGINGLQVIAQTSALNYVGTDKSPVEIGTELGVDYILDGSIYSEDLGNPNGRIRVIPQLIRVSDQSSIWANSYDQVVSDIFDMQEGIAQHVAEALNLTLFSTAQAPQPLRMTTNLDAYTYYLRGHEFSRNDEDASSLHLAETMLSQAVQEDASFARAYAELAKVHSAFWFHRIDRSEARCNAAQEAAEKALVYAPSDPESYTAIGMVTYRCHQNLAQAITYFDRAITLHPNTVDALRGKAFVLRRQGKLREALAHFEQVSTLDPLNADYTAIALTRQLLRDYPQAEEAYDLAFEYVPETALLHAIYARMQLASTGSGEAARRILDKGNNGVQDHDFTRITSIYIDLVSGAYQKALHRIMAMQQDIFDTQVFYIPAAHLKARALRGLGRIEEARAEEIRARAHLEAYVTQYPDDARAYSSLGRVYAGLGQKEAAVQAGQRALDLMPMQADAIQGPLRVEDMAAIYVQVGQYENALDQLHVLLTHPGFLSHKLLEIDPTWDALRSHPRFNQIMQQNGG